MKKLYFLIVLFSFHTYSSVADDVKEPIVQ